MRPPIVVGYDGTSHSRRALVEAGREGAWHGASVTVVHAFQRLPTAAPTAPTPLRVLEPLEDAAREIARDGADRLRIRYPGMPVEATAVSGAPSEILADLSREAALLVVGHRGQGGFKGLMLGSVAARAVTHASCPTMVVRGDEHEYRGRVLVAIDIADPADELLDFALHEADQRTARLKAVTVLESSPVSLQVTAQAQDRLGRILRPWQAKYPKVHVEREVVDGSAGTVLTAASAEADLVVVGAHRHNVGPRGGRLGPIAALLHHADCPVVVVPRS